MGIHEEPPSLETLAQALMGVDRNSTSYVEGLTEQDYLRYQMILEYAPDVVGINLYGHSELQQRQIGVKAIRILQRYQRRGGAPAEFTTFAAAFERGADLHRRARASRLMESPEEFQRELTDILRQVAAEEGRTMTDDDVRQVMEMVMEKLDDDENTLKTRRSLN